MTEGIYTPYAKKITEYSTPSQEADLQKQLEVAKMAQLQQESKARSDEHLLWQRHTVQSRGRNDFTTGYTDWSTDVLWNAPAKMGQDLSHQNDTNYNRLEAKREAARKEAEKRRKAQVYITWHSGCV